ncbi:MAG: hypothetical protein QW628_07635 [Thermofilum sp.]
MEEVQLGKKKDITTIKVSRELKEKLDMFGRKGETYEDIIWKLVRAYEAQKAPKGEKGDEAKEI